MYLEGNIVQKDIFKAFAWFHNAGKHGYVYSLFNESVMFEHGNSSIKINLPQALDLLK